MDLLVIEAGGNRQCYYQRTKSIKSFDKISFKDDYERDELSDLNVGKIDDLDYLKNDYTLVYSNSVIRARIHIGEKCLIESRWGISSEISIKPHNYICESRVVNNDKGYAYEGGVSRV